MLKEKLAIKNLHGERPVVISSAVLFVDTLSLHLSGWRPRNLKGVRPPKRPCAPYSDDTPSIPGGAAERQDFLFSNKRQPPVRAQDEMARGSAPGRLLWWL
jgi:hypothetical protein